MIDQPHFDPSASIAERICLNIAFSSGALLAFSILLMSIFVE
jgi:hypothetical protein